MSTHIEFEITTLAATRDLAERLAQTAQKPLTVALVGDLGAGKTQFVRYFAAAFGVAPADITSPTYVLFQRYVGTEQIYHFDFYRLESPEQVWDLGVDELYDDAAWILIEWADKFPECLPRDHLRLEITQSSSAHRMARLSATGPESAQLIDALRTSKRSRD